MRRSRIRHATMGPSLGRGLPSAAGRDNDPPRINANGRWADASIAGAFIPASVSCRESCLRLLKLLVCARVLVCRCHVARVFRARRSSSRRRYRRRWIITTSHHIHPCWWSGEFHLSNVNVLLAARMSSFISLPFINYHYKRILKHVLLDKI